MSDWRYKFGENKGTVIAVAIFVVMFAIYLFNHPAITDQGFTVTAVTNVVNTACNKGVVLALVAMAQTLVVVTAGIDLSVGMVFILCNCLASIIVIGSPVQTAVGVLGVLAIGAVCGAINGVIVIFGRLQPIVTTIATGAVYFGAALWLRPDPDVADAFNNDFAAAMMGQLPGGIPASLLGLVVIALVIWVPFRRSTIGRAAYAIGSSEVAAYMSGVPIRRAKFTAYTLSGLLSAMAGLYLTFTTASGEASLANGNTYTLYSIAAVVLGGVSLFGGSGSAIGAIFGAFAYRAIGDLLFDFDVEPLWQPLFQGIVLLLSVCVGAAQLVRVRNRLDLFG
ncbi:MAG TPA: ABC transporter permease [Magnetospirillaceae bacterium]